MPKVSLNLDVVPFSLLLAIAISLLYLLVTARLWKLPRYLRFWALATASMGTGFLLIVLRDTLPSLLSVLAGNLLLIVGYALLSAGTNMLHGHRSDRDGMIGAVFGVGFTVLYLFGATVELRIMLISTATLVFALLMIGRFLQGRLTFGRLTALAALTIIVVLTLARLVSTFSLGDWPEVVDGMNSVVVGLGVAAAIGLAAVLVIVCAIAPRSMAAAIAPDVTGSSDWRLPQGRCVLITPGGVELRLTGNEYLLLQQLAGGASPVDRVVLNAVIGRDGDNPKDRGIDSLISRLRRKGTDIGVELPITSIRGRGYVFGGDLRQV